jgi:hypothetical protein
MVGLTMVNSVNRFSVDGAKFDRLFQITQEMIGRGICMTIGLRA